ncbi:diaminopimelate epimerase [Ohtaekwangia koreensis]|uniref:Diaminopimelate epimerase n=1 Tax=Ohtaekwangia koreensis TaxID=688867 RepID=A0A1T5LBI0_9BACT|nr:diaminopimelate epimerase [Ohtaekwangia koreensis]SKC73330.1 diaminopimelate epimerase [Ohtaekwangia koreensis]
MKLHFYKYQATGNDFVVMDNREGKLSFTKEQIEKICHRKFGVGADGLMLIEKHPSLNFNLEYFNSDGSQSLCGNGSRAAVHFASQLGLVNGHSTFQAYDGPHSAELLSAGIIRLKMNDVKEIQLIGDDYFLNTGSPHYIRFVDDIKQYPVVEEGRKIRYSNAFKPGGTNVNFVQLLADNTIYVRTYERGVEDETLSCGTGVTAAALAASLKGYSSPVDIKVIGGDLSVEFKSSHSGTFSEIFLVGPAKMVFEGDLEL